MTAPLPPGHMLPPVCLDCGRWPDYPDGHHPSCASRAAVPVPEPAPDLAATAEQTVADLLALLAVYEARPIAYQWIRPSVIRSIIESGGAE